MIIEIYEIQDDISEGRQHGFIRTGMLDDMSRNKAIKVVENVWNGPLDSLDALKVDCELPFWGVKSWS